MNDILTTEEDWVAQVSHHFRPLGDCSSHNGRQSTGKCVLEEPVINQIRLNEKRCLEWIQTRACSAELTKTPCRCPLRVKNRWRIRQTDYAIYNKTKFDLTREEESLVTDESLALGFILATVRKSKTNRPGRWYNVCIIMWVEVFIIEV